MAVDSNQLSGRIVGTCTLQSLLGQGGMGVVYLAQQSRPRRTVAVKVLMPGFFQDASIQSEFLARFRREADAIAALDHINIMPIFEYGEQEDIAYLVMPYVTGGTLRQVLEKRYILPLNEALLIIEQTAAGLDYAHARGIIHRDLKPANILFHADGRVVLADFGLAKMLNETAEASADTSAPLTSIGAVIGTPEYFSPEQAVGNPIDQRTDIYSLGVVLYQMLGGRVPFTGTTPVAVAVKHTVELPQPLSQLNPAISHAVEAVVMKALAKKPAERFASAGEMARALRAAIAESSTQTQLRLAHREAANAERITPMVLMSNDTTVEISMVAEPLQETRGQITPQPPSYIAPQGNYPPVVAAPIISTPIRERPEKRRGYLSTWMTILGVTLALILVIGGLAAFLHMGGTPSASAPDLSPTRTVAAEATSTAANPGATAGLTHALIPVGALLYETAQPACNTSSQPWIANSNAGVNCGGSGTELTNSSARYLAGVYLDALPNSATFPNDYIIQVQAAEYGSSSTGFGVFFRNQPGLVHQGTYSFMLFPQQNRWEASVYNDTTGARTLLFGTGATVALQGFLTIDIVVQSDAFTFYINGQRQGGVINTQYPTGTIGLTVGGGTTAFFENLALYSLPG